jgi:AcrR family transcriptional regulator
MGKTESNGAPQKSDTPTARQKAEGAPSETRRAYTSPLRAQQKAETRRRILIVGAALAREFPSLDWRGLTFRAVARRAGVAERTVFRYFTTEQDLHRAVLRQLEKEAGVTYENLSLERLPVMASRVFKALGKFAVFHEGIGAHPSDVDPSLTEDDQRRHEALLGAIEIHSEKWTETERQQVAGVLDVLWSTITYERLLTSWKLDTDDAIAAITWVLDLVSGAIQSGQVPIQTAPSKRTTKGRQQKDSPR